MSTHWKHRATRCAIPECERTRRKGWTTCGLVGHHERGVSLYGLRTGEPRLRPEAPTVECDVCLTPMDGSGDESCEGCGGRDARPRWPEN